ncbi:MAG: DMT family transporter [Bacteroidales bacterium]|nr:DMT family transporter [Bacteroidales bacterium]
MVQSHVGEFAALLTAFFWTITALAFESASIRVGSLSVNILRLVFAFIFLGIFTWIRLGSPIPLDAPPSAWFWLSLSGLIGFVFGDLFLFKSYTIISSRISMLVMTLVPPIAALAGWIILGETLTLLNFLGMALTFTGISLAIFSRKTKQDKFKLNHPLKGLLFAFGGAVGQALGLVISKLGMGTYDAFASTQIRIIAGIFGFGIIVSFFRKWDRVGKAIKNKEGMRGIWIGSFFGPFLGVSFSLFAVQHAKAGVASTIMAIVPVLIIAPAALFFHQKVTVKEVIGAIISVAGVFLFFI